jgi:hypothetical protein
MKLSGKFQLSRPVQLLLLGLAVDRLKQIFEKLYFVLLLSLCSMEAKASTRPYAGCLFHLNIIFFPVTLGLIVVSSLFAAPLLAFFTLPVFAVAFARPTKFW